MIRRVIDVFKNGRKYEVDVLTAMLLSKVAWGVVTERNCFRQVLRRVLAVRSTPRETCFGGTVQIAELVETS